jgi:hypothetical protein
MCRISAQALGCGQPSSKLAQALKDLFGTQMSADLEGNLVFAQVDVITFLQAKLTDQLDRQTDSERIAPFCDLHNVLLL